MSNSLWLHALQQRQAPLSSAISWSLLKLFPLSRWCHLTISSSVVPFSCLQSFPASGSFPVSQLFASGGQSIGASASVLPMKIQGSFPLRLTGLTLLSNGLSRVFSSTTIWKYQFFGTKPSLWSNSHGLTWLPEKPYLDSMDLCQQTDVLILTWWPL